MHGLSFGLTLNELAGIVVLLGLIAALLAISFSLIDRYLAPPKPPDED